MSGSNRFVNGEVALSDLKGKAFSDLLAKKMNDANNYMVSELAEPKKDNNRSSRK